ncbi:MAG: hypothetical protein U5K29_06080 [Acidimicrobiales bacterium]|nr:hypothetical protein [Acidimicrobiales bacterium]
MRLDRAIVLRRLRTMADTLSDLDSLAGSTAAIASVTTDYRHYARAVAGWLDRTG